MLYNTCLLAIDDTSSVKVAKVDVHATKIHAVGGGVP